MPGFAHYFTGQTPLWVNWLGVLSGFGVQKVEYTVLRTHTNRFPMDPSSPNEAWVGLGADLMVKYSFGTNNVVNAQGYPIAFFGEPSIIACHIDQVGTFAGWPPTAGGPGQFRINFLHSQADPSLSLTPPGPGYEMTCVNNPTQSGGGPQYDWQYVFPATEIVSAEILAFTPP